MTCDEYRIAINEYRIAINTATLNSIPVATAEQTVEHAAGCMDCVRWEEEQMDAEDLERGVKTPITGEAAVAIEKEAAAEVHKMMVWHQYAAAALQGLIAGGWSGTSAFAAIHSSIPKGVAKCACEYADAMMEEIRQRKLM